MSRSSSLLRAAGPAAGLAARGALVATVLVGLTFAGTKPAAAMGAGSAIVTSYVHDSHENVVTSVPVGEKVHPRFVVTGLSGTPTGSMYTYRWANATCSGTWSWVAAEPLSNGKLDEYYLAETANDPTSISYRGDYQGDATYGKAQGQCISVSFVKADPAVTLQMHDASHNVVTTVKVGTSIHGFVKVNGSADGPTGGVRVREWPNGTCSNSSSLVGPYSLSGGQVDTPFDWPMNTAGTYSFRADYLGDSTYNAANSACLAVTVEKYTPTFTSELRDTANHQVDSVPVGTTVHAYATLSGAVGFPTGVVTVKQYTGGTCSGAPFSTALLGTFPVIDPAGQPLSSPTPTSISWQLSYSGDATYAAVAGPCLAVRWKVAPTIDLAVHDASHNVVTTAAAGTPLHLRVDVGGAWGTPTGAVTLTRYANDTCSGTATPIGSPILASGVIDQGKLTVTFKTAGTYSFRAAYAGDSTYLDKASGCVSVTITTPVATPTPTVAPTPAPTANATAAPDATSTPTDASATDQPAESAPAPTAAAIADAGATPTPTTAPIDAAQGGTGSGGTTPAGPSTGSGLEMAWIFPILLVLLLALILGSRFARRRRREESAMPA